MKDTYVKRLKKIAECFARIGGIPEEIRKESGLKEIEELGVLDEEWAKEHNPVIALEVWVQFSEQDSAAPIYLCWEQPENYYDLFREGIVKSGKLVIGGDKLSQLAQKGYRCICIKQEPRNESFIEQCRNIFGDSVEEHDVKAWGEIPLMAQRGLNTVVLLLDYRVELTEELKEHEVWGKLVSTQLGDYALSVDLYAVESCMKALEKERFIRETMNSEFYLREDYFDDVVDVWDMLDYLRPGKQGVFIAETGGRIEDFPQCYQKLAHQTAYMRCYYPDAEERMKKIEEESVFRNVKSMGIALAEHMSLGAYCTSDGVVKLVQSQTENLLPEASDYRFEGYGSMLNAGVASSQIGLSIRRIKRRLEDIKGEQMERVVISLPINSPESGAIREAAKNRRRKGETSAMDKRDWKIASELGLCDATAWDIAKKAGEMAGFSEVSVCPRALAVAYAYEQSGLIDALVEMETVLVYDWDGNYFGATILQKYRGEIDILWQEIMEVPMRESESANEPAFLERVKEDMRQKICKENEDFLQLFGFDDSNEEAWNAFFASAEKAMNQVLHGKNAELVLQSAWGRIACDYSQPSFTKIFGPYYQKTEQLMEKIVRDAGFSITDISKIFMAGEWANYPPVFTYLQAFLGRYGKVCKMADTELIPVKGVAYMTRNEEENGAE